jgi:hypothetical protein
LRGVHIDLIFKFSIPSVILFRGYKDELMEDHNKVEKRFREVAE